MATAKKSGATKRAGGGSLKPWAVRALLALVAGLSIGAGAGVFTVNKLEPGRGTGVDSLAAMLDSLARGNVPAVRGAENGGMPAAAAPADTPAAPAAEVIAVPALADLEEGAARNALLDAGLQVGEVQFQASPKPAGTVLATIPAAGANVAPNTPVTLVLSDGRPSPADTMFTASSSSPSSDTP